MDDRADHLSPADRARAIAVRPRDVEEAARLGEGLRLALGTDEHLGDARRCPCATDELREPCVIEEDDGVAGVETEQIDVAHEIGGTSPASVIRGGTGAPTKHKEDRFAIPSCHRDERSAEELRGRDVLHLVRLRDGLVRDVAAVRVDALAAARDRPWRAATMPMSAIFSA